MISIRSAITVAILLTCPVFAGKPSIVRFTASWCGPCRQYEAAQTPAWRAWMTSLYETYPAVDVDARPDLVRKYKLTRIPTWIVFQNGKETGRVVGLDSQLSMPDRLRKLQGQLIAITPDPVAASQPAEYQSQQRGGVYLLRSGPDLASCVAVQTDDERTHFLTINHAVQSGDLRAVIDGREYPLTIVDRFPGRPEAVVLMRSESDLPVKSYPIAKAAPVERQAVYLQAFPRGRYKWTKTTVRSVQSGYYVTAGETDVGASGGALLNADGEVVAIVSGIEGGESFSVAIDPTAMGQYRKVQWRCGPDACFPSYCQPSGPPVIYEQPAIDMSQVNQTVIQWLEANADRLRGPRGPAGQPGAMGLPGRNGIDGKRGLGIQKIWITDDNHIQITYTDGTVDRLGPLTVDEPEQSSVPAFFDIVPKGT